MPYQCQQKQCRAALPAGAASNMNSVRACYNSCAYQQRPRPMRIEPVHCRYQPRVICLETATGYGGQHPVGAPLNQRC